MSDLRVKILEIKSTTSLSQVNGLEMWSCPLCDGFSQSTSEMDYIAHKDDCVYKLASETKKGIPYEKLRCCGNCRYFFRSFCRPENKCNKTGILIMGDELCEQWKFNAKNDKDRLIENV